MCGAMNKEEKKFLHFTITYNVAFLLPLLIISLFVMQLFWNQQRQNMDVEAGRILERQTEYWRQQMSSIRAFNKRCKFDKKYNGGYSDETAIFSVYEEFRNMETTFSFVDEICVYDIENDMVLTSDGKVSRDLFFGSICNMDQQIFEGELEESKIYAYTVSFPNEHEGGIVFLTPIRTWGKDSAETKFFMYLVKKSTLDSQFGKISYDGFSALLLDGEIFFLSCEPEGEVSKQDFYNYISESDDYVKYTKSLEEDFKMSIFFPESAIWEIMRICLQGYGTYFVCSLVIGMVVLWFFTRRRYIIYKNLIINKIELLQERDFLKREGCLYELLLRTESASDDLVQKCLENDIRVDRRYKVFLSYIKTGMLEKEEKLTRLININEKSELYKMEFLEGVNVFLLCTDEDKSILNSRLNELKRDEIAVGKVVEEISKLRNSYEQSIKNMNQYLHIDKYYPKREISSLEKALAAGNVLKAELILEELCGLLEDMDESTAVLVLWSVTDILQMNKDEVIDLIKNTEGSIQEKAKTLIDGIRDKMFRGKHNKVLENENKKRSIEDVKKYIYEHCLDDNFSVKYLAANFNTSVSNISHFFKKSMGITISQYVEELKLDRAKQMLLDSDMRISEIASVLRYANSTVFIEMFKRYEGMTPGNYREIMQKDASS